ncbi:LysE family translocator [Hoeflea sp.]|uniref:LysE family translocator n=1 Tax=Hoeflea sp. TaxID=1940281 RepID=UPI002AFF1496|nr:LysE family translocator [Hoeflea sp.]
MTALILSLVLFLFPLAYGPGPGNMFFVALGSRHGFASTIPPNLGYHLATLISTFLIGLGLVSVIDPDSMVFEVMKAAGSLYVLWLAYKMLRAGADANEAGKGYGAGFRDGALLLVLNPNVYVIILLMFTQFAGAGPFDLLGQVALVTAVFTINNFLAFVLWTLAGDRLGSLFRGKSSARMLNAGLPPCLPVWRYGCF